MKASRSRSTPSFAGFGAFSTLLVGQFVCSLPLIPTRIRQCHVLGSVGDTLFSDVIADAESVRLNPASTKGQLEEQKDLLEKINLGQG